MASNTASRALGKGPAGLVEGGKGVGFGPVGFLGGRLGVQLSSPLVDLRPDVVPAGGGVDLHLRPLAPCLVGGHAGLLLGVLNGDLSVVLCLVDSLLELVARLGGGSLCRRLGIGDAPLEVIEL
jgi:hypothetical protein